MAIEHTGRTYAFYDGIYPVLTDERGDYIQVDEFKKIEVRECHICEDLVLSGDDVRIHGVSICCPCSDAIMNLKNYKHSGRYITWDNPEDDRPKRKGRPKIRPSVRREVHERDHYACRYCGARQQLEVDHVVPVTQEGGNDVGNLVTACRPCNFAKFNRTPEEAGMVLHPPGEFA